MEVAIGAKEVKCWGTAARQKEKAAEHGGLAVWERGGGGGRCDGVSDERWGKLYAG